MPPTLARPGIHEAHRGDVGAEFRQHRHRLRPLQRDQRAIGQRLDDADIGQMRAQMRFVVGLAGGVDHQKQMVAEIGHHQVVENAAVRVGELRVALPARRDRQQYPAAPAAPAPARRPRPCRISAAARSGPYGRRRTGRRGAGMQMFLQHAGGVLHRHVIAGERHHLAAARHMQGVQRGAFQGESRSSRASITGPSRFSGENPSKTRQKAPSVAVPESIIPSADASGRKPSASLSRC